MPFFIQLAIICEIGVKPKPFVLFFKDFLEMAIVIKTAEEIESMRRACRLASEVLDYIEPFIKPGVPTIDLDRLMNEYMLAHGAVSACLGYAPAGFTPYPASTCISINHVVCHGIPSEKPLKKGDIVNIDVTIILDGFYGDTSRMFMVGDKISVSARHLVEATYECMWRGIDAVAPGRSLNEVGIACEKVARAEGLSVVHEYGGHGVGRNFHEDPFVCHYNAPRENNVILKPGMIFTVEPMLNAGHRYISGLNDGWTVITRDRSLSAQWEHTVLVTETGYEVLTLSEGYPPIPEFITRK